MTDTTPYTVPQEPGRWQAIGLAVVVHVALLAFLWIGVSWQSETPVTVEAEVWDLQAKEAAPLPPPQPEPKPEPKISVQPEPKAAPAPQPAAKTPPQNNPDIALEQEKKRREEERQAKLKAQAEKEKLAALEKQKAEERARKLKEDAERERQAKLKDQAEKEKLAALEKQKEERVRKQKEETEKKRKQEQQEAELLAKIRAEDMRKITAGTSGTGGAGDAPKSQGMRGDPSYAARISTRIKSNTSYAVPPDLQGNPSVEYDVQLFPDGTVRGTPRKVKSSGIPAFDEAVRRAIELSQPFPADKSGTVPSSLRIVHQPKEQ